jgi:hypothetical protein
MVGIVAKIGIVAIAAIVAIVAKVAIVGIVGIVGIAGMVATARVGEPRDSPCEDTSCQSRKTCPILHLFSPWSSYASVTCWLAEGN